jgi:nucleoside-diphosphate-sugar epimerase
MNIKKNTFEGYYLDVPEDDLSSILFEVNSWEQLRNKNIFISGATGFVGKWILSSLLYVNSKLSLDVEIYILSRNSKNFLTSFPDIKNYTNINWVDGNIRDFSLNESISIDFAIHAAADVASQRLAIDIFDDCYIGTKNLMQNLSGAGCTRILLLSSGAVYGDLSGSIDSVSENYNGAPNTMMASSAYGEGKRASELVSSIFAYECGMSISVARCFAFVGPYLPLDKHFAIGNFILNALHDEPIIIKGDGTPMRSYLYSSDLTIWLWTILFSGKNLTAYNVGGNDPLSIKNLAKKVVRVINSKSQIIVKKPNNKKKNAQKYYPDLSFTKNELNLKQNINLDSAILKTARFNNNQIQ